MNTLRLIVVLILFTLFSCSNKETTIEVPQAPDYENSDYWFGDLSSESDKAVDIFYVYPTQNFNSVDENGNPIYWASIDQEEERKMMYNNQRFFQVVYAADDYNFYAPFYRQIVLEVYRGDRETRLEKSKIPVEDIKNAFQHYMKHFNNGRPFILMGHSQGSSVLIELLKNSMTDEQFQQMIAAYTIGFEIRAEDLAAYPHRLIPAKDSADTHCVILYNSLTNPEAASPVLAHSAVGINPINWKTDATLATKEQHRGMALWDENSETYQIVPNVTGGYLSAHNMICSDIDPEDCYIEEFDDLFPKGNLHLMESFLYAADLKHNIKIRVNAFFEKYKNEK